MASNGNGQLTDEQVRALTAAANAQRALDAIEDDRLPVLRSKRDSAFAAALRADVPASTIAERVGLTAGRLSQMRRRFEEVGLL